MAATATSEVDDLKSFFEDVLETETLISKDHPVTTSDVLLHVNLLEKSIELLQISQETNLNGWGSQSMNKPG